MIDATFIYNQENTIIKCNLEDKMEDICRNFTSEKSLNNLKLYFLYGGEQINLKLPLNEIISDIDEKDKIMTIFVEKVDPNFERSNSVASNISVNEPKLNNPLFNEHNDVLIPREEQNDLNRKKKHYLLKIYIFLIIQFILIGVNILLFLLFKYNNIFISSTQSILLTFIPNSIFLILMFLFFYYITKDYKESETWLFIYNILYIVCMIFYSFLLSKYIKTQIILIATIVIILILFSLMINIIIFKYYSFFRLIILPIIINIISSFVNYCFWIKDIYENIYIFLFGIGVILYFFITIHHLSFKYCKADEYFFGLILTNLSIIAGLAFCIKLIIKRLIASFKHQEFIKIKKYLVKLNLILIIQFSGIYIFFNKSEFKISLKVFLYCTCLPGLFSYIVLYSIKKSKIYFKTFCFTSISFIPIIGFFFLFLTNYNNKQYLRFILLLIIALLVVMEIYSLFFIIFNTILLILFILGVSILVSIFFNFYSIHNFSSTFIIFIISSAYLIYLNIVIHKVVKKYEGEEIFFTIACINYVIFFPFAICWTIITYFYYNIQNCQWAESLPSFFSIF